MPISSCFTNASLLCISVLPVPGLAAGVQEFERHWEGPLFASCSKPLSPELPRVWPPKGSLVHLGVLCPFRQGACAFHQHRSTIGLACAQAVAIRGAPDAARRHAAVPRALPLRVAYDDWDLNDFHECARA